MFRLGKLVLTLLALTLVVSVWASAQVPCDPFVICRSESSGWNAPGYGGGYQSTKDLRGIIGKKTWISFEYQLAAGNNLIVQINNVQIGYLYGADTAWHSAVIQFDSMILKGLKDSVTVSAVPLLGQKMGWSAWRNIIIHAYPAAPVKLFWIRVGIHPHSTHSDGSRTLAEMATKAKSLWYDALIPTDHAEQIDKTKKAWYGFILGGKVAVGYNNYVAECKRLSTSTFLVVPGVEIETTWNPEPGVVERSHTTAFPWPTTASDPVIDSLYGKLNGTTDVLRRVMQMGMIAGAAHSELIATKVDGVPLWEWQRFRYDFRNERDWSPQLLEFFNCATTDQEAGVLSRYHNVKSCFGTWYVPYSGNDSHGWLDIEDKERWQRVTYVLVPSLTTASLVNSISNGYTMAFAQGMVPKTLSAAPGPRHWVCKTPSFSFKFVFWSWDKPGKSVGSPLATKMRLYRDGVFVTGSEIAIKKGQTSVSYKFTDRSATVGEHRYDIVTDNCLMTAPIWVDVVNFNL